LLAKAKSSPDEEIEEAEAQVENESGQSQEREDDFKFTPDSDLAGLHKAAARERREFRAFLSRRELKMEPEAEQDVGAEPSAPVLEALSACRFRARGVGPLGREYIPIDPRNMERSNGRNPADRAIEGLLHILRMFGIRLRQSVGSLTYLGPLRTHPERLYALHGLPEGSVGIQGEQAVQILYHDAASARRGHAMIDHLNTYCGQFEIPYRFALDSIRSEITGDFVVLSLTDRRTGVKVAPTDVGFGSGQILPILVEGMVAQNQGRYPRIVCVEQPEIHLHPRLQAAMADFFMDTAYLVATGGKTEQRSRRGVQWILETRSETLVLSTTLLPLIKPLIISVFLARLDLHYFQYCFSDYCRGIIVTL
jgi:hypothetical protein